MANVDPTAPAQHATASAGAGDGEHDVAIHLDAISGVASVHDRAIPGSRAVIDHVAIGPSGVYVIDTTTHRGSVERRDNRLIVDERDRTDLAIAMSHRVGAVSAVLSDLRLPISRALCFVGGEWPPTMLPFMLRGVWIGFPVQLYRLVAQPGVLQPRDIETALELLEAQLRPVG